MIAYNDEHAVIEPINTNYINIFSFCMSKHCREDLRDKVKKYLIDSLACEDNEWTLNELSNMARVLSKNKIGEDEIWLMIEEKVVSLVNERKD